MPNPFGAMRGAVGAVAGGGAKPAVSKQQMMQQKQPQGIGPSPNAMQGMTQGMGQAFGRPAPMPQMPMGPQMGGMNRPPMRPPMQGPMQGMASAGSMLGAGMMGGKNPYMMQKPMQPPQAFDNNMMRNQVQEPPPEYRQAGEAAGNDMSWMDRQRDMQQQMQNMVAGGGQGPQQAMRQSPMMPRFMGPQMRTFGR